MFCLEIRNFHSLSFSVSSQLWYLQTWQILDDGSNLPIIRMVFPDNSDLYSNFVTKYTPSQITYRLCKMMILNHAFNIQSFNSYCLVLDNKFKREFGFKIIPPICYFLVKYSIFLFGFFSVFRTILLSTNSSSEYFKSLQRVFQVLRIFKLFSSLNKSKIFYSNVYTNSRRFRKHLFNWNFFSIFH